ncbi:MAG: protein kinase [Planctomycetaceae bacterium]|nr:protein kinase [Planctomycetaceae bacterium]
MESRLKTGCPECGQKLNVSEKLLGHKVKCPTCEHRWVLESVGFSSGQTIETRLDALRTLDGASHDSENDERKNIRESAEAESTLERISRFELKEVLGGGGFGIVYRAYDPTLGRMIALKVPKFGPEDEAKSRRFLTEAHAAASLHHPNIVAVYESGREGDRLFIVSEFVEGDVLSNRIQQQPANFRESAAWVRDVADGLALAHTEGIIHRDIKPANIMLNPKDRPMIMDFGLARLRHEDSQVTGDGSLLGTPAYMSPEQARGEVDSVGPLSDQYSLGVVLYELLTGRRPFDGPPHSVIAQVVSADPPELRKLNRNIPQDLAAICTKAMEKDPEKRYADLNEMVEDLSRWLSGRETFARPLSLWEKGRRWYAKNPTVGKLWLTVGGLLSILLLVATIDYARTKFIATRQEQMIETEGQARIDAQRALVINEFERGRKLCETGDIDHGLLWLASSLQKLTPEQKDLEFPIRSYIGSWLPRIHQLKAVIKIDKPVNDTAISPDGIELLTGSGIIDQTIHAAGPRSDFASLGTGELRRWDLKTGKPLAETIVCDGTVTTVDYSPDGTIVTCGSLDHKLRILDAKTFQELHAPLEHPHAITCQAFSHDGKFLATGCFDEHVRIWNTQTWELVGTPFRHPPAHPDEKYWRGNPFPWIWQVGFSSDDRKLLVGVFEMKPPLSLKVSIWDIGSHVLIHDPAHAEIPLNGFSADGAEVSINRKDGVVHLANVDDFGQETLHIRDPGTFWNAEVNRDSNLFLADRDYHAGWIFDLRSGLRVGQLLRHEGRLRSYSISPDGKTLVSADQDGEIRIWSTATTRPNQALITHNRVGVAHFLPDSKTLFTTDNRWARPEDAVEGEPATVERFWDASTLQMIHGPYFSNARDRGYAFTKNSEHYARTTWDSIGIFRVRDGSAVMPTQSHPGGIASSCFMADDSMLITGTENGWLRFWDCSSGKILGDPMQVATGSIATIRVSPDEKYLAFGGNSGEVKILDLQSRTVVSESIKLPKTVWSIAFHPNGKLLATACHDNSVYFWRVPDGRPSGIPLVNINPSELLVNSVAFSPDGRQFMTMGGARGIEFWDLETRLPASGVIANRTYNHGADLSSTGDRIVAWGYGYDFLARINAELIDVPPPLEGSPESIKSLIEKTLGLRLHHDDALRVLTAEEFQARSEITTSHNADSR